MQIKIKLSELIDARGISQRELARLTDIRRTTVSDMCRNDIKQLPLDNLAKICEVLECDISDVIKLEKAPGE